MIVNIPPAPQIGIPITIVEPADTKRQVATFKAAKTRELNDPLIVKQYPIDKKSKRKELRLIRNNVSKHYSQVLKMIRNIYPEDFNAQYERIILKRYMS